MFKESFKYYKSKNTSTDLSAVIDVDKPECIIEAASPSRVLDDDDADATHILNPKPQQPVVTEGILVNPIILNPNNIIKSMDNMYDNLSSPSSSHEFPGLKPITEWKCYEIQTNKSGLIFIRNPFTQNGQRYWITKCLRDYPKAPHRTNLYNHTGISKEAINDWWSTTTTATAMAMNGNDVEKHNNNNRHRKSEINLKYAMRWVTLGYHHNWDTKIYSESMKHKFPLDLEKLTKYFAIIFGYHQYRAEAAIVNYYPIGSTLAGHTDHSEVDLDAPLFSISFGQSAIFLIGGKTRDEKPSAIFLRSGDVIIMSKESRLCYHAVPKVFKTTDSEPWNVCVIGDDDDDGTADCINDRDDVIQNKRRKIDKNHNHNNVDYIDSDVWIKCQDKDYWKLFESYIKDCRININVRQVLPVGQTHLSLKNS